MRTQNLNNTASVVLTAAALYFLTCSAATCLAATNNKMINPQPEPPGKQMIVSETKINPVNTQLKPAVKPTAKINHSLINPQPEPPGKLQKQ